LAENCVGYMYVMFVLGVVMGFMPMGFQWLNNWLERRRGN